MEHESELKAGHPPAVKVGGVRIVQHKTKEDKDSPPPKPSSDEVAVYGEDKPVKPPTVRETSRHQSLCLKHVFLIRRMIINWDWRV
jgi:hypothetical protein